MPDSESYDIVAPRASALVESLRAFSYDLASAIADLIDNSITAQAENVWIDFHWNGEDSAIVIVDDGLGMSENQLVAAMRPGSQSPTAPREPVDLGRFGLGLKTASFSQCRRVTVTSKRMGGASATRRWDLDHVAAVDQWQLLRAGDERSRLLSERLDGLPHGTVVVWQALDRVTTGHGPQSETGQRAFHDAAAGVERRLALVFHELMRGRDRVVIHLNSRPVQPWDPFMAEHPATQVLPRTEIRLRDAKVDVQPFVLPHHSKLKDAEFRAGAGTRGWNAHQGFYVYRRKRLLVAGDWLGLGWAREEHYKLARIRLEFPNALDLEWSLDVTKSRAFPPPALRAELRKIAERARSAAMRVYTFRGAKLTTSTDDARVMLWSHFAKHDRVTYRLNREHPVLKRVLASAADRGAVHALLHLIEETVPHAHITVQNSEQPRSLTGPFEHATEAQVADVMREALRCLIAAGYTRKEARQQLSTLWPFELFPAVLQALIEEE
jgi:hypothetical protein